MFHDGMRLALAKWFHRSDRWFGDLWDQHTLTPA
jgi:hypothetical protein